MTDRSPCEPAATVIAVCGGAAIVAEIVERDLARVHRWTYERDRGGTGGHIPGNLHQKLLDGARGRGIDLRPEHFFLRDASEAEAPASPEAAE